MEGSIYLWGIGQVRSVYSHVLYWVCKPVHLVMYDIQVFIFIVYVRLHKFLVKHSCGVITFHQYTTFLWHFLPLLLCCILETRWWKFIPQWLVPFYLLCTVANTGIGYDHGIRDKRFQEVGKTFRIFMLHLQWYFPYTMTSLMKCCRWRQNLVLLIFIWNICFQST